MHLHGQLYAWAQTSVPGTHQQSRVYLVWISPGARLLGESCGAHRSSLDHHYCDSPCERLWSGSQLLVVTRYVSGGVRDELELLPPEDISSGFGGCSIRTREELYSSCLVVLVDLQNLFDCPGASRCLQLCSIEPAERHCPNGFVSML